MSSASPRALADGVIAGFNVGDWNRLGELFATDIAYTETGTGRAVQGAEPYMQLLQGWRHVFPDCTGTIRATAVDGSTVVHEMVWEGTHAAPLPTPSGEIPASGRRIAVAGTLWYTVAGGKITAIHHHLDVFTMLQQLGAFDQPRA